jgi:hypothetical protein
MNAYTTIEESKQLIEAGLDVNTADMHYIICIRDLEVKAYVSSNHSNFKRRLYQSA